MRGGEGGLKVGGGASCNHLMTPTEGRKSRLRPLLKPNFNQSFGLARSFSLICRREFLGDGVCALLGECLCVVAVSPSHCVLAAEGGRAQLMSLSAAG